MSCINEAGYLVDKGACIIWDKKGLQGCNKLGYCTCSDSDNPSECCNMYESDYICRKCGEDLNVKKCDCK